MIKKFNKLILAAIVVIGLSTVVYAAVAKWIFVPNAASKTLSFVDPQKEMVIGHCDTGPTGWLACLTPDLKKIYVGNNGGTTVTVVDAIKHKTLKQIETGKNPKHPLVTPDGKYVLINHTGEVKAVLLDAKTDKELKTFAVEHQNKAYKGPLMMHSAFTWDSKYAFVQNYADKKAYVLKIPSMEVAATIDGDSPAHYFIPTPDNKQVWIVYEGSDAVKIKPSVSIVDMATFKEIKKIEIPTAEGEPIEGHHGIFTLDGKYFYFCNRGPGPKFGGTTVAIIDVAQQKVVRTIKAANGVGHPYLTPDGKYVVLTPYGSNIITIVDAKTGLKLKDIAIGNGNHIGHIVFSADGRKAYASNAADGALYVIDMQTREVTKGIPTGDKAAQVINTYTNLFEVPGVYKHEHVH
jgi:YVTN family beta-propeller protein